MLTAIDLDDNPELVTSEVGEVRTDCRLASKAMPLEWRLPQMLPELLFGFSRVTTQRSRAGNAVVDGTLLPLWHPPPTPDPSPPRASRAEGGE
jgi:hypothetical protein